MNKFIFCILVVLTIISGCKSIDNDSFNQFEQAPLFGMIYNSESSPVAGAVVVLDDVKSSQTDINGRVLFGEVSRGEHSVLITKEGFEEVWMVLDFSNRNQVLYSTLISLQNILDNLESHLQVGRITESKSFLDRASGINSEDIRFRYLNVVYLMAIKEYPEALEEIVLLRKSYPDDPYLTMTHAKILFFGLNKKKDALKVMQKLLLLNRNEDFKSLLEKIDSEINT